VCMCACVCVCARAFVYYDMCLLCICEHENTECCHLTVDESLKGFVCINDF
jgi:hypothetical protein